MKRIVFASIVFLTSFLSSFGQTTIWTEDFSTSSNYSVTLGGEGNDGSKDYFQRTDGSNINVSYSGNTNDFFAAQDIDDGGWAGSASPSELTWTDIDISDYSSLTFKGLFASAATDKIDESDYIKIEINIDGGGWTTILEFENDGSTYNTEFGEDTDFDGNSDGTDLSSTLTNFSKSISGTGSLIDLRITIALNSGDEDFAFDEFYIKGDATSCSAPTTQASSITFSSIDYNAMDVSWTDGDGDRRIVIINTTNSFTDPTDGDDPAANSTYSGSGEQVVYNSDGSSISVDGLSSNTTYWFRVYEYNCTGSNTIYITDTETDNPNSQKTKECVEPSSEASSISFSSIDHNSMTVSWTNGDGDNRLVVIHESTAVSSDPSDGATYSANTTFGSGDDIGSNEYVIYNGTGTSVTVTNLSESTTYYFEIFEYNCSNGEEDYFCSSTLTGNETTTAAPVITVLEKGDIAVVGVNSNTTCISGTSAGDDEISFICFKDITTDTEIDMTDNGWEKCSSGEWGNTEGYLRIKRTGSTIEAGTVITFRTHGSGDEFEGIFPDNDWSVEISGSGARIILNSNGDQLYFMQGGTWDNGTTNDNNATYTGGTVLFGFNTNDTWTSGICSASNSSSGNGKSQNSGLYDDMDCFNMMPSGATDFLKYTGPSTEASQIEWMGRLNDGSNWTSYTGSDNTEKCNNYYAGAPDYTNGDTLDISTSGIDATYNWYGNKNTDWFDCANWGPLKIPTSSDDVIIPNSSQVDTNIVLVAGEDPKCKNFTVQSPDYTIIGEDGETKKITIYGNLVIDGGSIDFDDDDNSTSDGTIYLKGDWTNNNSSSNFACGNSTVVFNGSSEQTINSTSGTEAFYNVKIQNTSGLDLNGSDATISGVLDLTQGLITTGSNKLTISNTDESAVINHSGSSYVNGNLRRYISSTGTGSYDFPLGTSSQYEIANINLNSSSGITYFDGTFTNPVGTTDITDLGLTVNETELTTLLNYGFWTFTPDNSSYTVNYDITITSRGHDNGGTEAAQHTIVKRDNSSSDWTSFDSPKHDNSTQSGTGSDPITAKLSGLEAFSDFAIARNKEFPLPVKLLSFTAQETKEGVLLQWTTASEINNDYFKLNRAGKDLYFNPLAEIQGFGNSNSILTYEYLDIQPLPNLSYYQLLQYDFDGTISTLGIVSIHHIAKLDYRIVEDRLIFNVTKSKSQPQIDIYNSIGQKLLATQEVSADKLIIDLSFLSKNTVYLIRITTKDKEETIKYIK